MRNQMDVTHVVADSFKRPFKTKKSLEFCVVCSEMLKAGRRYETQLIRTPGSNKQADHKIGTYNIRAKKNITAYK